MAEEKKFENQEFLNMFESIPEEVQREEEEKEKKKQERQEAYNAANKKKILTAEEAADALREKQEMVDRMMLDDFIPEQEGLNDLGKIRQQLYRKQTEFMATYRSYLKGGDVEESLDGRVSEPFMELLRKRQRRIEKKHTGTELNIDDDEKVGDKDGHFDIRKGKNDSLIGVSQRNLSITKSFQVGSNDITKEHSKEASSLYFVKEKNYEPIITSYSIEENAGNRAATLITKWIKQAFFISLAFIILGLICLFVVMGLCNAGVIGINDISSFRGLLLFVNLTPAAVISWIAIAVIFFIANVAILGYFNRPMAGVDIIKRALPKFDEEAFYRDLSYVLSNIHYADVPSETEPFTRTKLDAALVNYADVIDFELTRIQFKTISIVDEKYLIELTATCKLTEVKNAKVVSGYEQLNLTMFGSPSVLQPESHLRLEYRCPSCGRVISAKDNFSCKRCGEKMDYTEYGWVIQSYNLRRQKLGLFKKIKTCLFVAYAVIFLGSFLGLALTDDGSSWLSIRNVLNSQFSFVEKSFDSVPLPNDQNLFGDDEEDGTWEDAVAIQEEETYTTRTIYYKLGTEDETLAAYEQAILSKGYTELSSKKGSFVVYLPTKYQNGDAYYVKVTVTKLKKGQELDLSNTFGVGDSTGDQICIKMELVDSIK